MDSLVTQRTGKSLRYFKVKYSKIYFMRKIIITKKLILETAKKYKSVREWDSRSKTTCRAGRKMFGEAFYQKAISHMKNKKMPKYQILKVAKKYRSVRDFLKYDKEVFAHTRRWGKEFHKKATAHMTLPYIKWTKKTIIADAKKYKRKMEWAKKSPSAYSASYTLGVNKVASKHFEKVGSHVSRCIYSISIKGKKIIYIGLTYDYQRRTNNHLKSKRLKLLIKNYGKKNIIFKRLTKYLPTEKAKILEGKYIKYYKNKDYELLNIAKYGGVGNTPSKWTNKKILLEAKKYNSISEWNRKDKNTLSIAYRRRIIDKCKKHMKPLLRPNFWWKSKDAVMKTAKRFKIRKDWKRNEPLAYNYARQKGFFEEAVAHMKPVVRWNKKLVTKESLRFKTRSDWQKSSGGSYRYALENNLLDKLIPKTEYVYRGKWTVKNIIKEAKKYKSISEWQNNSWASYKRSREIGLSNVIKSKRKLINWNENLLIKDAKKYKSRSEWHMKSPTAYKFALENGYLKKIFPKTFGYGNRNYD